MANLSSPSTSTLIPPPPLPYHHQVSNLLLCHNDWQTQWVSNFCFNHTWLEGDRFLSLNPPMQSWVILQRSLSPPCCSIYYHLFHHLCRHCTFISDVDEDDIPAWLDNEDNDPSVAQPLIVVLEPSIPSSELLSEPQLPFPLQRSQRVRWPLECYQNHYVKNQQVLKYQLSTMMNQDTWIALLLDWDENPKCLLTCHFDNLYQQATCELSTELLKLIHSIFMWSSKKVT